MDGLSTAIGLVEKAAEIAKNEKVMGKSGEILGKLFPYFGLKSKALSVYIEEIEKSDLPTEAKVLSILTAKKEIKRIKNQGAIAKIAVDNAKEGTDFSEDSKVSEEWLDRYMESAQFVCDEDIRLIWGKVLANEFEQPGSTPPNMRRILTELTPKLAEVFRLICSMSVTFIEKRGPVTYEIPKTVVPYMGELAKKVEEYGVDFHNINELDTLGLITYDATGFCTQGFIAEEIGITINNKSWVISGGLTDSIPIGNVRLTSAGEALKRIVDPVELGNYSELITEYFESKGLYLL